MQRLRLSLSQVVLSFITVYAQPTPSMIGLGLDVKNSNLWDFDPTTRDVFDAMPLECIEEYGCSHESGFFYYSNLDTSSWAETFVSSFGVTASVSFDGFRGSIAASVGKSDSYTWIEQRNVFYGIYKNVQKCYRLSDTCLKNGTMYSSVVAAISRQDLPLDTNATSMDIWREVILSQFGTHVITQSGNGAAIKTTESADVSCQFSSDCLLHRACLNLGFLGIADISLCSNKTQCDISSGCESTISQSCVIDGGDNNFTADQLCNNNTGTPELLQSFLNSGDPTSPSTVVQVGLIKLWELLAHVPTVPLATLHVLQKAVEYDGCSPPMAWMLNSASAEFSCQCNITCLNGGVKDPDSCTCSCRGDRAHGWKGETCSDTYGTCQPGPGSNDKACPGDTDYCNSRRESPKCLDTDVCCNRDEHAACCPFGSSCHCTGGRCDCVPPGSAVFPISV
jgi:hypothetical protein